MKAIKIHTMYRDGANYKDNTPEVILNELKTERKSTGWCGSAEDLEKFKTALAPYNIKYVDDFNGTWETVLSERTEKHTVGDWQAKDGQIYQSETGKTLALIPYFDKDNEEDQANQKLMAAAKDLLEAMQMLDDAILGGDAGRISDILLSYGRPAISKAIH